jgi:formamidopyrimidine-DNA glycosylase
MRRHRRPAHLTRQTFPPTASLMPELPEVETVVRQLAELLPGRRIRNVDVIHSDLLRESPTSFRRALLGSTIESVGRRGKNILLVLAPPGMLVVNLGMTGQLLFFPPTTSNSTEGVEPRPSSEATEEPPSHLALAFKLEPSGRLLYSDTRRFGSFRRFNPAEWEGESARLGPEPLSTELTPGVFHRRLAASGSPIRSWLLDQTRIAGIGNIYASESLFRAGIHPKRPARSLGPKESERLLAAIRDVLSDAIRARGTTFRDYRTASGDRGGFGPSLQVYGQEGNPCPRCKVPIERIVFANRSAFLCPICQSRP